MIRVLSLLATFTLAACTDWPQVDGPENREVTRTWPELRPLSELRTASGEPVTDTTEIEALIERTEALQRRAATLRRPVPDRDAFDALREELAQ